MGNQRAAVTFGNDYSASTLNFVVTNQIIKFPVGHSMSTAQKDAWDELLHGKTSDEGVEVEAEDVPATKLDEAAPKQSMDMKRFSLCFNGRIDVSMIANSLVHILGDNAVGEVEIVCNLG